MQKIPCSVIRDLLVLYEDDVCSKDTKQIVEEHIENCVECRDIYEKTMQSLPEIDTEPEEANLMKEVLNGFHEDRTRMKGEAAEQWKMIEKAFRRIRIRLSLRILVVTGAVMLVLLSGVVFWNAFLKNRVDRVPYEDLKIIELYELSTGDIYCTLEAKEKFLCAELDNIQTPEGKKFRDYDEAWHEIFLRYPHFYEEEPLEPLLHNKVSFVFPMSEEVRSNLESEPAAHEVSKIYYNCKGEKNAVVIWEEGQKIPKAPAELDEKIVKEAKESCEMTGDPTYGLGPWSKPIELPGESVK